MPDSRESSKKMVALAQELHRRTHPERGDIQPTNLNDIARAEWLIQSCRSLAGSVLSQADPND